LNDAVRFFVRFQLGEVEQEARKNAFPSPNFLRWKIAAIHVSDVGRGGNLSILTGVLGEKNMVSVKKILKLYEA
jgi:hypothetical protein